LRNYLKHANFDRKIICFMKCCDDFINKFLHQYETGVDRKSAAADPDIMGKARAFGAGFLSTKSL